MIPLNEMKHLTWDEMVEIARSVDSTLVDECLARTATTYWLTTRLLIVIYGTRHTLPQLRNAAEILMDTLDPREIVTAKRVLGL